MARLLELDVPGALTAAHVRATVQAGGVSVRWCKRAGTCRRCTGTWRRLATLCSPPLARKNCRRVGTWAAANDVEIAYAPTGCSWLNRIEAPFAALCCFTLDGADHADHKERGGMIRRCIIWWNKRTVDIRLRTVVARVNVA
ncbi:MULTISPECIES: hypothetical protein [Streptomyces]|uniref:Transposase n=1 Tax=Streptomyces nymphaeiformis TaxID=2663842 RepID=A0A7W7U9S7_9ACTN|nr:hypothetical protein [Streptomyces nymphaeiformis]